MSEDWRSPEDPKSAHLPGCILFVTGIASPLVLGLAVFVAGSRYPGYSHVSQFISELGATGAPSPSILNFGGLIPAGALTIAFAVAMYWRYRSGAVLAVSSALVALAGLFRLIAGIFPCDPGCSLEAMSRSAQIHALAGLLSFVCGTVAPFLFAVAFRSERALLSWLSLVLGAGALVAFIVGSRLGADFPCIGVLQRLHLAFFYAWVVVVAVFGTTRHPSIQR
jgi:hypothetical membrane protein